MSKYCQGFKTRTTGLVGLESTNNESTYTFILQVGGNPDSPTQCGECYSCYCSGKFIICTTNYGVQFGFDGEKTAFVKVDKRFASKVNGICGNFNDNGADDFLMKNGEKPPGKGSREQERNLGQQWLIPGEDEDAEE